MAENELEQVIATWNLTGEEASAVVGVGEEEVARWRDSGVSARYLPVLANLTAATTRLAEHVRRERIATVVRRPAESLGGQSLLALAREGEHAQVRDAVERRLDVGRVQP